MTKKAWALFTPGGKLARACINRSGKDIGDELVIHTKEKGIFEHVFVGKEQTVRPVEIVWEVEE